MAILDTPAKVAQGAGGIVQGGFNQITNPLGVFNRNVDLRVEHDFPEGFSFVEIQDGKRLEGERIRLLGSWMIQQPFEFGGETRLTKDYYPGNTEPVVHILGPQETDVIVKGRFHSKKIRGDTNLANVAQEIQEQCDAIRIRANLVEITLGDWRRFGFLTKTSFKLKRKSDIEYELTFSIVGFNQPKNCNQIDTENLPDFKINKDLISQANAQFSEQPPLTMPGNIADFIRNEMAAVASIIAVATNFIDNVITTTEDIADSLNRASGLVRHARSELSRFRRRIGGIRIENLAGRNIVERYTHFAFIGTQITSSNNLSDILARLQAQFATLSKTVPLRRHRVVEGESLQKISVQYYNDATQWEKIYDHNGLTTTELVSGAVLEIPRI